MRRTVAWSIVIILTWTTSAHAVVLFSDGFETYVGSNNPLDANYAPGPNAAPNGGPGNPWFGPLPPNLRVVSAGGGLAAGLALLARDRGEVPVAFQLLECPMIDDRQVTSSSRLDGLPIWSREANEFGWRSYLGAIYGGDVPEYAAAARATNRAGLPPALVIVGGADGFRDEDIEYARRLLQADVPTELHAYPGGIHGFDLLAPASALAQRFIHDRDEALRRAFRL